MHLLGVLIIAVTLILKAGTVTAQNDIKPCILDCYQAAFETEPCNDIKACCKFATFIKKSFKCVKSECRNEEDQDTCARAGRPFPLEFVIPPASSTESTTGASETVSSTPSISATSTKFSMTTSTPSKTSSLSPTASSEYHTGDMSGSSRGLKIALGVAIPLAAIAASVAFFCIRRYYLQKKRNQSPEEQGSELGPKSESKGEIPTAPGPQNPPPDPTTVPNTVLSPGYTPVSQPYISQAPPPQTGYIIELDGTETQTTSRAPPLHLISAGIQQDTVPNESSVPPLTFLSSPSLERSSSSPYPATARHPEAMRQQAQRATAPSPLTDSSDSTGSGSLADDIRLFTTTLADIQRHRTMRERIDPDTSKKKSTCFAR